MAEYDNEKRGVLFKNDRKEKDTHPDYRGSCEIEGIEYWMSAWVKEGKSGKFMSFSFQPKEGQARPAHNAQAVADNDGFDDDVPF